MSSAGKTFSLTGWKIGWVTRARRARDRGAHRQAVPHLRGRHPAAARGGRRAHRWRTASTSAAPPICGAKRDRLCAGLEAAGFEVYRPAGTYFVNVDIRPLGEEDGVAFCWALPERAGVVAVPTSVFFDDQAVGRPLVRFAFCKRDEVIDEGVARLRTLAPARGPR